MRIRRRRERRQPAIISSTPIETGRPSVNGIQIYYEVHGRHDGTPLVLLHRGGSTIDSNFGRVLPFLAANGRVIALEEQGHGRTSDCDQPVTFERSADDVAGLLGYLQVSQADARLLVLPSGHGDYLAEASSAPADTDYAEDHGPPGRTVSRCERPAVFSGMRTR